MDPLERSIDGWYMTRTKDDCLAIAILNDLRKMEIALDDAQSFDIYTRMHNIRTGKAFVLDFQVPGYLERILESNLHEKYNVSIYAPSNILWQRMLLRSPLAKGMIVLDTDKPFLPPAPGIYIETKDESGIAHAVTVLDSASQATWVDYDGKVSVTGWTGLKPMWGYMTIGRQ